MKLLVVDTDADMVEIWSSWLRTRGYQTKCALTAENMRRMWVQHQPDLVLANVDLPGVNILDLCCELRRTHDAFVLAVSNERSPETEVRSLESGADDFLVKPYVPAQLLAHIHALTRRAGDSLQRSPPLIVNVGSIRVDSLRHEVTVHGSTVRLTPIESKLLYLLAINANNVCTLDYIVTHIWGFDCEADTMLLVKPHIRRLREKIERDPSKPHLIVTVVGSGYVLVHQPVQLPSSVTSFDAGELGDVVHETDFDLAVEWTAN